MQCPTQSLCSTAATAPSTSKPAFIWLLTNHAKQIGPSRGSGRRTHSMMMAIVMVNVCVPCGRQRGPPRSRRLCRRSCGLSQLGQTPWPDRLIQLCQSPTTKATPPAPPAPVAEEIVVMMNICLRIYIRLQVTVVLGCACGNGSDGNDGKTGP